MNDRAFLPTVLLLLAFTIAWAPVARGQQSDTTQLPEITPREIEIRGEREIALPSLQRQPLSGFASPPRIPEVPSDHRPYTESYEQEVDDLPESLPLPENVADPLRPTLPAARGFVEATGGRYLGRTFKSRVLAPVSQAERVSLQGDYSGLEAQPNADVASATARFESHRDLVHVDVGAHGSAQTYALYGRTTQPADRSSYDAQTSLQLRGRGTVPLSGRVEYGHSEFTTETGTGTSQSGTVTQGQLHLQGALTAPIPLLPSVDGQYSHSWLGGDIQNGTAYSFSVGGALSFFETDSSTVEVGVRGLGFDTPVGLSAGTPARVGATYIVPTLDVEWPLANGFVAHLRNEPRLEKASLTDLYAENPYAQHAPPLRPTVETTNAEVGLTVSTGLVRVNVTGRYRYAPTYRSFVPAATSGLFQVRYDTARILEGQARFALQGPEGIQASIGAAVRDGLLKGPGTNTVIPNFASVTADAMLTASFAGGDGFVEIQGQVAGPRFASTSQSNRLDPYVNLDVRSSYAVSTNIDLLVHAENLAPIAPTYWVGYPRPPARITGGLRIHW